MIESIVKCACVVEPEQPRRAPLARTFRKAEKRAQKPRARFWIRGRRLWFAKPARSVLRADWNRPVTVFVHHTADPGPRKSDVRRYLRQIQRFHQETRGWSDIAYNYLIAPDGTAWEGRGYEVVGAHTEGRNSKSIGVCFMGTFTTAAPTPAAVAAFDQLLERLRLHGAQISGVHGHGDVYPTACPGRGVRQAVLG